MGKLVPPLNSISLVLSLLAAISMRQTLVPYDCNEGVEGQQASESKAAVPRAPSSIGSLRDLYGVVYC